MTRPLFVFGFAALVAAGPALAQSAVNPPAIDPQQVIQSQPQPRTTLPSAVPINPSTGAPRATPPREVSPPPGRVGRDRVAICQHQAAVERVPRSKRGAYINVCMQGGD